MKLPQPARHDIFVTLRSGAISGGARKGPLDGDCRSSIHSCTSGRTFA